jgi:hypothetical protein
MSRKKERGFWALALLALVLLAATPIVTYQPEMDVIELKGTATTAAIRKIDLPDSGRGWSQITQIGIKGPHRGETGTTRDTLVLNMPGDSQTDMHRMPYYNTSVNLDVFEAASAKIRSMALTDTIIAWKFSSASADSVMIYLWGN